MTLQNPPLSRPLSGAFVGTDKSRLLPGTLEDRLMVWLYRLAGLALIIACAAGWLTLMSWSASDPSLSHATGTTPRNWLGPMGAILSDLSLQTLGLTAIFAYLAPAVWGVQFLTAGQVPKFKLKLLLYPVSILVLAGAMSSLPLIRSWPLNHGYGGIVGDLVLGLATSLLSMVNPERATIAAGVMFFAGGFAALFASLGMTQRELQMLWQRPQRAAGRGRANSGGTADKTMSFAEVVANIGSRAGRSGPLAKVAAGDVNEHVRAGVRSLAAGIGSLLRGRGLRQQAPPCAEGPDPGFCPADADTSGRQWGEGWSTAASVPASRFMSSARQDSSRDGAGAGPARDSFEPRLDFGVTRAKCDMQGRCAGDPSAAEDIDPRDARGLHDGRSARDAGASSPVVAAPRRHEHRARQTFSERTEHESHAIAQRFAPNARARDLALQGDQAVVSEAPGPTGTASATRPGAGFLAGLKAMRRAAVSYRRPSLNLLKRGAAARPGPEFTKTVLRGNARLLEDTLGDFGIKGEIKDIKPGPVVTLFELEPARGTKSSRVISLADDIARSMSATSARVAVVPGRNVIGIELPNLRRETVLLREVFESEAFRSSEATLPLALGKSISGDAVVADLARMPHLLVAGTTGSGKSVGVNAMILSLLYRKTPDQCRLLMIDPKMLELSVYNGIPHLLCPVVTDPQRAVNALGWVVGEMEERYKRMAQLGVRNIDVFNNRLRNAKKRGEALARRVHTGFDRLSGEAIYEREEFDLKPMPYIVVVVDEFADLMVVAGKEIEAHVQRLAQMARASGIHLIMATQRPSVDIITGTIKANFPTRISFKVTSKVDSRTILNEQGAEQLLGHGDMLFASGMGQISRVHGPLVTDEEVEQITTYLRQQGEPDYIDGIAEAPAGDAAGAGEGSRQNAANGNDLYERAVAIVLRDEKASTSYLQRRLSIGYNKAADLIERMEADGMVSAAGAGGKRQILTAGGAERA